MQVTGLDRNLDDSLADLLGKVGRKCRRNTFSITNLVNDYIHQSVRGLLS